MPRNVEIKARIHSIDALAAAVAARADQGPTPIAQDHTFLRCDSTSKPSNTPAPQTLSA